VSAGDNDVSRAATDEVGDCLLRNRDLVERILRRKRWGIMTGIENQVMGNLSRGNCRKWPLLRKGMYELKLMVDQVS
jgi:hypothetical protein